MLIKQTIFKLAMLCLLSISPILMAQPAYKTTSGKSNHQQHSANTSSNTDAPYTNGKYPIQSMAVAQGTVLNLPNYLAVGLPTTPTVPVSKGGPVFYDPGYASGGIPSATVSPDNAGVTATFDNPNFVISGTVQQAVNYSITLSYISNNSGLKVTYTFHINASGVPVFHGPIPDQNLIVNKPMTNLDTSKYFTTAPASTLNYTMAGQPSGINIDSASGVISGTATTAGSNSVTVTATDSKGSATSDPFKIDVQNDNAPKLKQPIPDQTTYINEDFPSLNLADDISSPDGSTLHFSKLTAQPSLSGLSVSDAGVVSGKVTSGNLQTYQMTFTVSNDAGSKDFNFNVILHSNAPTLTGTIPDQNFDQGIAITPIDLSQYFTGPDPSKDPGAAITYSIPNLPLGLSIDSTGHVISGTPSTPEPSTKVTVTAKNNYGSVSSDFNVAVLGVHVQACPTVNQVVLGNRQPITVGATTFNANSGPSSLDYVNPAGASLTSDHHFECDYSSPGGGSNLTYTSSDNTLFQHSSSSDVDSGNQTIRYYQ